MAKAKSVLGRGLDALINPHKIGQEQEIVTDFDKLKKDDGAKDDILAKIATDRISPNPYQPRASFDAAAMEELKKSVIENGLIQPITVRRIAKDKYQLISGERRLKVFQEIGYKDIPAYIIKVDREETMLAMALIENIQRERLNPIEIGLAFKRLMDECHLTQDQIAEKVGKDRSTVANSIRLLKLPKEIQESLIKDEISAGHARALINIPSEELQLLLLKKIVGSNLSVRKVEHLVKKILAEDSMPKRKSPVRIFTPSSANLNDIEDKMRKIFGTKVICRQRKDGSGEIVIEFYSPDELDRLFDLFDIIDKSYN